MSDPFGPPVDDPAGETERPGRLAVLRGLTIDLTPLRRSQAFRRLWFGNAVSTSQLLSALAAVAGVALLAWGSLHRRREARP